MLFLFTLMSMNMVYLFILVKCCSCLPWCQWIWFTCLV